MNEELVSALVGIIKVEGLQEATRQINQFSENMREAAKDVAREMGVADKAVKQHQKTFRTMVQDNAAQIRTAGRYMTVFGAALTGLVTKGGQEFIKFQREAANVSTMLSGTISEVSGQMAVYSSGIKDLSIEFNQTTSTLQKGLYDILSASVAPAQALEVLKVSAEAATAGISTVAVSADAITTILNAYGYEAERAADVSDKLWAIVRRGKITFDEVASSIGNVATTAAVAGLSYEELGAGIATATRAGYEHRRAMTGMNSAILAFLKNTDEQQEMAKKFGFELSSMTLKTEGLIGVVKKLAGANEMNRKATAEEIVSIFANKRALVALLPILRDQAGYLEDVSLMTNSAGLSSLAFSKIAKTLDFQLGQLGKTIKVVLMEYFEPLAPIIEKIVAAVKYLADAFRNLSPGLKAAISTITLLSGVFLTLSGVILMLLPGLAALTKAIGGPAVIAVGVLIAALVGGGGLVAALIQSSQAIKNADAAIHEHIATMRDAEATYKSEQATFDRIIARYKELKQVLATTTPGTEEHTKAEKDLQLVINEITKIVPEAASAWDKYGKAIDVNIKTVKRAAEVHKHLFDIKQQIRLRDLAEEAGNLRKQQENRDKEIENIRQQIERERGYLEFLAQERQRLLAQKGGEDFMAGPLESVQEFDASWNNMAGTIAGTIAPSLTEIEEGFVKTSASIAEWTEKLLKLDQESLDYNLTIKEMAVHLVDLSERGIITDTSLNHLLDTVPRLKGEFERLKSEGVKPFDEEFGNLMLTMADVRSAFPNADAWIKSISDGAIPVTKTWKEELEEFNTKVKDAEKSLRSLYESGTEVDLEERIQAEKTLVDAINKRAEAVKKAVEEEKKANDEFYDDLRSNSGWSTNAVISDIERRMAAEREAGREAGALYIALGNKLVIEQRKANSAYVKIWDDTVSSINRGMEDMISEIIKGNKTIGDAFEDLGQVIVDSFIEAFAKSIVEKLGFDTLFKNNIFGLANFFESTLGGLFSGGLGAVTGQTAGITTAAALEGGAITAGGVSAGTTFDLGASGITAIGEAAEYSALELAQMGAEINTINGVTWIDLSGTGLVEAGEAAEYTAAELNAMGMAGQNAGLSLMQQGTVIAAIVDGLVQGGERFQNAFEDGILTANGMKEAMVGVGTVINPVGARFAEMFDSASLQAMGLNEDLATVGDRMAEFAVMGSIIPVIGTGLGAVGGALFGIAENIGVVKHGTSGMENYAARLEDVASGASDARGALDELRWLFFGEDFMGGGKGGYLSDILEKPFEEREEWFQKYVEDLGIYSDEQKNEIRDMMQLWGTEAENASGKQRAAFEIANQSMESFMYDWAWGNEQRMDEIGGWAEAFESAWDAAARGEGNLQDLFRGALEAQTGDWEKSAEEIDHIMQIFEKSYGDFGKISPDAIQMDSEQVQDDVRKVGLLYADAFDELDKALYGNGESWDEWYDGIAVALNMAGTDMNTFGNATSATINKFLKGGMDDLRSALLEIPGMTEDMADQFVADAEKMKEAGETDFSFSDEQIKKAEESMAKMDEIIADSGGIEQWRENWGEAFSELDISGLSDKAAEAGDKFERSFSGILRGMDIAGSIDTSEAEQRMREAGYDAGREYKAGFEEGASGSGILGDVMWDEDVISLAVSRFSEAGRELGAAMKGGFALEGEGRFSRMEQDLIGLANVAVPSFPVVGIDQREGLELPAGGGRIMEVERVLEREGSVSNNATTTNYFSISVQAPSGSPNDKEYWRRLSREKIMPAFKEELAREGKKLGGR